MTSKPEIHDWVDATRPMSHIVRQALARLREAIEPPRRITEPMIAMPSFDEVREVRPSQPIIP